MSKSTIKYKGNPIKVEWRVTGSGIDNQPEIGERRNHQIHIIMNNQEDTYDYVWVFRGRSYPQFEHNGELLGSYKKLVEFIVNKYY